jgi:hypothetical protein
MSTILKSGDKIRMLKNDWLSSDTEVGDILVFREFTDSDRDQFIADTEDGTDYWYFYVSGLGNGFELIEEKKPALVTNIVNNVTVTNTEEFRKAILDLMDKESSGSRVIESPAKIDSHYNFFYMLSPEEIEAKQIKIDPYFVSKQWRVGERDASGALFHILKTIARFGDKNPKEREIKAIYLQIKRLAELEGVELE